MSPLQGPLGHGLNWIIRRNPTYLISAVLMAVGARLLLVSPNDPAGDVRLIVATLVVLQVYEWAVGAILVALHRSLRSPEDKPSLLLVAAVFWTGPLAATLEMIALRPGLGTYVAAGACVIALGEMRVFSRAIGLRLSAAAQAVGGACVILVAGAAPLLKIPDGNSGENELYLYAAWWVFALVLLGCIGAIRSHHRRAAQFDSASLQSVPALEFAFLAIATIATAVHLIGMNYGFFCHASHFYASPALVALSVVGFEFLAAQTRKNPWSLLPPLVLPAIAILLALRPFDARVPVDALPQWTRDPLASIAVVSAMAWWFGYVRLRRGVLLHAGNAACAVAAFALARGRGMAVAHVSLPPLIQGLYIVTAYLATMALLRRSRAEAVVALAVHLLATSLVIDGRTPADKLIICLVAGWSAMAGVHLALCRPRLRMRLLPIALLAILPWTLDAAPMFRMEIALHSGVLMILLFVFGQIWRWTHYRAIAGVLALGHLSCAAGYGMLQTAHPVAVTLLCGGFIALVGGAVISWHKAELLKWVPLVIVDAPTMCADEAQDEEVHPFNEARQELFRMRGSSAPTRRGTWTARVSKAAWPGSDEAHAHRQRPAHPARLRWFAPGRGHVLAELLERPPAACYFQAPHGRPGVDVAEQLRQRPVRVHVDRRRGHFPERKRKISIAVLNQHPFGRPAGPGHVVVEVIEHRTDRTVDNRPAVGHQRHGRARPAHPPHLVIIQIEVIPVCRLRGDREVDACIGQAAVFRFCATKGDAVAGLRAGDLFGAGVRRLDASKVDREVG